jgi:hypothetical protein
MRNLPASLLLLLMVPWLGAAEGDERIRARSDAAARDAAQATTRLVPMGAPRVAAAPPVGAIAISGVTRTGSGDVPRYGRLELVVAFSAMTGTKHYDVRTDATNDGIDLQATFTAPDGGIWRIPGYYDGTDWRVRFAPDAAGLWTYTVRAVDRSGSSTWSGGSFTCAGSSGHGWVRVDGRWLRHADGTAFCPVPHNTGWQTDVEQPALSALATDAPAGSAPRLLSFWLSVPWSDAPVGRKIIETGNASTWTYDQNTCTYIEGVVARAEAAGVYLLPSIWAHDQLRRGTTVDSGGIPAWGDPGDQSNRWVDGPYASICDAEDFFLVSSSGNDTEQWHRQRNLFRYLIARWGSSPAIAGWVGVVELNGTTGWALDATSKATAQSWTVAVDDWFVANDPYRSRHGRTVVTTSLTDAGGEFLLDPGSTLSARSFDCYGSQYGDQDIASRIASQCISLAAGGKPVLITEFGGNTTASTSPAHPAAVPLDHLRNGAWASLAAGASMPAMLWSDGISFPMLEATASGPMRQHLAHLAKFIGPNTWLADDTQTIAALTTSAPGTVRGWSRRITDRGMAWLQRYSGSAALDGTTTSVTCANGTYAVWWFNTSTGAESTAIDVPVAAGSLPLTIPTTANPDIAVSWQRYPATPTGISVTVPAGESLLFTLATGAPASRITALPAHGRLWQTADGVTAGAEITTVPTVITDPSRRVIYQASAFLGLETFTFAATDARLSRTATASITVTNPPPGSSIIPIEEVPGSGGCGAGAFAGLSLLTLFGLLGLRRPRARTTA